MELDNWTWWPTRRWTWWQKKYLIFICWGWGLFLGVFFGAGRIWGIFRPIYFEWAEIIQRADFDYFPPHLPWIGGNYNFRPGRGRFLPEAYILGSKYWSGGTQQCCWSMIGLTTAFYFLPGEIVRLPCNCQLTNHARCVSVLSWEARKQTSRKSWASRKKLGWHRNHPAPHPDFVYKILPQTFYNQVLVSKKMNDPLCTDQVCFKKKFFSAATVKP